MNQGYLGRLSILQRWLLSFVLSLTPLLLLVVYAVWILDQQGREQYQMATEVLSLKKNNMKLRQSFTGLERSLRQYEILKDAELLPLMYGRRDTLKQTQQQLLLNVVFEANHLQALSKMFELWQASVEQLIELTRQGESIDKPIAQASAQLTRIEQQIESAIETKLKSSEQKFKAAEWLLLMLAVLVLPISITLIVLSIRTITRPLLSLTGTINQLGKGLWHKSIRIDGPADLVALGERLEWMREKLNSAEQQKRLFLQHVTHELKTPLAAVMEAASLLSDEIPGPLNEQQQQVLSILHSNSESLHELILQLLSFHSLLTNPAPVYQSFDVAHMIRLMLAGYRDYPKSIQWQISPTPLSVNSDPFRIQMILKNVLSNALHYSEDPVHIDIQWQETKSNWQLIIKDNGKGIHPKDIQYIFEPFYQGSTRRHGPIKGSGIGLAIVKQCVLSLNGDIQVKSTLGEGTEFMLVFPKV
jgi:two-component system sensor histidine kinase GlrK